MSGDQLKSLREDLGLSREDCAELLGLGGPESVRLMEDGATPAPDEHLRKLATLNAKVETAVLAEVEYFTQGGERDIVLMRFMSDDEFALYEPDLFERFDHLVQLHGAFITRAKRAIERLGGEVTVAFMDSEFYEAWLGVNDFDDSRDLRVAWARQQIRGLTK